MCTGVLPAGHRQHLFDFDVDHPRMSLRIKLLDTQRWSRACTINLGKEDPERVVNVLSLSHEAIEINVDRMNLSAGCKELVVRTAASSYPLL